MYYLTTIPWKGSEDQLTVLLALGVVVGYSIYINIAKKDSSSTPRKPLWK